MEMHWSSGVTTNDLWKESLVTTALTTPKTGCQGSFKEPAELKFGKKRVGHILAT